VKLLCFRDSFGFCETEDHVLASCFLVPYSD
jgi:hypothetical protein